MTDTSPMEPAPMETAPMETANVAAAKIVKLEKLLLAEDAAAIAQGLELAITLDDPEVWRGLLAGVSYSNDAGATTEPQAFGKASFVPNDRFAHRFTVRQQWRQFALTSLVASCPIAIDDGERPLRDAVVELEISLPRDRDGQLSLRPLAGFKNLERLKLDNRGPVSHLSVLSECSELAELSVRGYGPPAGGKSVFSLEVFAGFRALRRLDLHLNPSITGLEGMAACRELRELFVRFCPSPLSVSQNLRSLEIDRCDDTTIQGGEGLTRLVVSGGGLSGAYRGTSTMRLKGCVALETIELRRCRVDDFADLRALRSFSIAKSKLSDVDGEMIRALMGIDEFSMSEIEGLTVLAVPPGSRPRDGALDLRGCRDLVDLGNVDSMIGLRGLLVDAENLTSLEPVRGCKELEILDIRATRVSDLSPIVDLPKLRAVYVSGSAVTHVPPELHGVVNLAAKPSLGKILDALRAGGPVPVSARRGARAGSSVAGASPADMCQLELQLCASNLDGALGAADFAASLGPAMVDYLLERVTWVNRTERLKARPPFRLADPTLLVAGVARLLLHAPAGSMAAEPLRSLTRLTIACPKSPRRGTLTLDEIHAFTSLKTLIVKDCEAVVSADLSQSGLRELEIDAEAVSNLIAGPSLELVGLRCRQIVPDLGGLATGPVHTLVSNGFDATDLLGCTTLRRICAPGGVGNADALFKLPLTEFGYGERVPVDTWIGHPTLTTIWRPKYDSESDADRSPKGLTVPVVRIAHRPHPSIFHLPPPELDPDF